MFCLFSSLARRHTDSEYTRVCDERDALAKKLKAAESELSSRSSSGVKQGALEKQASAQAAEYMRVLDENKRLTLEIGRLTNQLTAKSATQKKTD